MSLITGIHRCIDCRQNLCTNCSVIRGHLKSHCVVPLPLEKDRKEFNGQPCPTHVNHAADMFCWHCRHLVCTVCSTSPEHRDHSCDDVVSSATRLRAVLLNDAASVDQRQQRCDEVEADIAAEKDSWLSSVQTADNHITALADQLRALVDRRCAELRDELAATKQLRLKELRSRLEDVADERSRLDSLRTSLRAMVDTSTADHRQLLLNAGSLHDAAERCLADTSRGPFGSRQTVVFAPSVSPAWSSEDGDGLLGRVQVVGGEVRSQSQRLTAVQTKPSLTSCEQTGRTGRHLPPPPTRQHADLPSYRQQLATLSDGRLPVCGLALVVDRLYVCRSHSADVDVYDAARTTYRRRGSVHVPGLSEPSDMAGAARGDGAVGARLFVSSESDGVVFRVTRGAGGDDVRQARWSTDDRPYGVSPLGFAHLLVLSRQAASVSVLDDDGRPLRRLQLPASVASPWSALLLPPGDAAAAPAGDLVVCHDDADGLRRCVSRLDWRTGAVTQRHDWFHQPRRHPRRSSHAVHAVAESDTGGLLLSDQCCDTVERIDDRLTSRLPLLQTSSRVSADDDDDDDVDPVVEQPRRLCVDAARQRLVVGLDDGRVKVFANGCVVM